MNTRPWGGKKTEVICVVAHCLYHSNINISSNRKNSSLVFERKCCISWLTSQMIRTEICYSFPESLHSIPKMTTA
jgi:hypothetical protein